MKKAADILYLLATFSIRTNFCEKAGRYAEVGYRLFPEDRRLIEVFAYTLLLDGKFAEAEDILTSTTETSANLEFLRSRTAIILDLPQDEKQNRVRKYLAA